MPPDDDLLTEARFLGRHFLLTAMKLDIQEALHRRYLKFVEATGREHPEVLAQLAQLFGPSDPPALLAAEVGDSMTDALEPRARRGRKPKTDGGLSTLD